MRWASCRKSTASPSPSASRPDQIRAAYGIDNIKFGSVTGDGTGQTIAIVDAYDDPSFVNSTASSFASSDLAQFDAQLGIPDPPSFTKVNQSGQASPAPNRSRRRRQHQRQLGDRGGPRYRMGARHRAGGEHRSRRSQHGQQRGSFAAVATAAGLPGVSAVSMSWGDNEFSGETAQDSTFVTPAGHQGVTFLAASGDSGGFAPDAQGQPTTTTPGILYPAASPNVVAVGGTSLQLNADDTYNSETAWSGSGGGTSLYETQPAYQQGVQQTGNRTIPDVSFVADPNTGVAIYDSYNNTDGSGPWVEIGGTSLAAPAWAGLIAIANQGRVLAGASTLDGPARRCRPSMPSRRPTSTTSPAAATASSRPDPATMK